MQDAIDKGDLQFPETTRYKSKQVDADPFPAAPINAAAADCSTLFFLGLERRGEQTKERKRQLSLKISVLGWRRKKGN